MKRHALAALAALALPLPLAACSSAVSSDDRAASVCPPRTSLATPTSLGSPAASSGLTEVRSFGDNPAALKMFLHAPASGRASAIVVALHGCTQGARDYVGAGWNELADAAGFAVVYPEQSTANNAQRCFRWFDKAQIGRGAGEARSIAAMVEHASRELGARRAFVTGLSAGAAMTAVMLATYPDLFEAGAIMAGLPYACATSQNEAYPCMSPGRDKTPEAWAALVPASAHGAAPRVSIWHGDADWIVRPMNGAELVDQWTGVDGVTSKPSSTETVEGAKHAEYKDASGVVRVESWVVPGMGHGVALAPKTGCGKAGAYMLDEGICSTTHAAAFFGLAADGAQAPGTSRAPSGSSAEAAGAAIGDCEP